VLFVFTIVLLSVFIRCNDTVSARMNLVCLAHSTVSCVYYLSKT